MTAPMDAPPGRTTEKTGSTVDSYLADAATADPVPAELCLKIAKEWLATGNSQEALRWAAAVTDSGDELQHWLAAAAVARKVPRQNPVTFRRNARVALAGSFTTAQLATILPLAALRQGIDLTIWEAPYGQYRQELLDPHSALYASQPDFIIIAVHEKELALPFISDDPASDIAQETARWTTLWEAIQRNSAAYVVQFNFALPAEAPMGNLATRLAGSRYSMTQAVNAEMGKAAGASVAIVDCERLSGLVGKERWVDPRYWHLAKQAVSLAALPLLARHVSAVLAARLGLSRKCLVLDLDNTLWGGVIGEDGLSGIKIGGDQTGEAFSEFQEYVLRLKDKGILLAAVSKNNDQDAREPFEKHPEMKLRLDDFAVFIANWEPKSDNIRNVARILGIGLDSLVFVDDNPVECAAVRRALPEVDVVSLPGDPSLYARRLSGYLMFETAEFTREDTNRTALYRARAESASAGEASGSLEDFWKSLDMTATIAPFDEVALPRIVQLIGKTNQFNLTTRRHGESRIREFMADSRVVHFSTRLRDRFADHGLVGLMIATQSDEMLEIDTWLMSCRVLGRTLERTMLARLCEEARLRGARRIRGLYLPTARNQVAGGVFRDSGFELAGERDGGQVWEYDLTSAGCITNDLIRIAGAVQENGSPRASSADFQGSVE